MGAGYMKRQIKKMNRFFRRYVNGTKGVISIMLALFMMPMLSIALILVESARYQSAIETLEELLDSAGLSTLAEYDPYLEDRFGVLSVEQKGQIDTTFSEYLNKNIDIQGESVTLNSVHATGDYALSDTSVLKQQLLEYSEIIVPAQAAYDIGDVKDWLSELEEGFEGKLDKITKTANVMTNSATLASDFAEFVTNIKELTKKYTEMKEKETAYREAYTVFETAVLDLVEAIKTAQTKQENQDAEENESENTDTTPADPYESSEVKAAIREAEEKRDAYRDATEAYAEVLQEFGDKLASTIADIEKLSQDARNVKEAKKEVDEAAKKTQKGNQEGERNTQEQNEADSSSAEDTSWIIEKVEIAGDLINDTIGRNYSDQLASDIQRLQDQQRTIRNFKGKNVTQTTTKASVQETYGPIAITSYDNFSNFFVRLAQELLGTEENEADKKNFLNYLGAGMDLVDQLLDLNFVYDGALNAAVPSGSLYNTNVGGEVYGEALASSMNNLLSAMHEVYSLVVSEGDEDLQNRSLWAKVWDWLNDVWNFIKGIASALARLLTAIGEFLKAIVAFVCDWLKGVAGLLYNGPSELYNSFLLTGYAAYTLPNRTNYQSGKSLTGYSFSKVFQDLAGGSRAHRLSGSLKNWTDSGSVAATHELFYGAEMEYVTIGTQNEINNQAAAFFAIYLMRLLLDFEAVTTDVWVKSQETAGNLASFGTAGTIFKYLMVLLEPLLDTLILVNGGSEYLIKENIYVTPTGLLIFLSDLTKASGLSNVVQEKVANGVKEYAQQQKKVGKGKSDSNFLKRKGTFDMSYNETLMMLCFFTVDQDTLLARLQNLMQMEAAYHYRNQYDFKLNKTYTYIYSDVTGSLNPMLKLDRLGENGPFQIRRKQYTGY